MSKKRVKTTELDKLQMNCDCLKRSLVGGNIHAILQRFGLNRTLG